MFKTALIVSLLSSLVVFVASQAVECPPTDKDGSPLQGPGTNAGQGFITCTYATAGACTYFGESGEFSSGSSTCPVGIPQGTGTTSSTSSSSAPQTITSSTSTSASVAPVTTSSTTTSASISTSSSSSSSAIITVSTSSSTTSASTSGFTTLPASSIQTSTIEVSPTSLPPASSSGSTSSNSNSAATVFKRGSISSAIGIMMIVTVMNFA